MKKILFSLLMLCCMTAAWAGTGTGTKDDPYTGEWQASELGPMLEPGKYLDFNCVIKNGQITVRDTKLDKEVAFNWTEWAPGNLINDPQSNSPYYQYGKDNPSTNRQGQSFIITYVSPSAKTQTRFTISGYFSGFYSTPDADGFVYVATAKQMETVLHGNAHAKIRITDDIYLTDKSDDDTFCNTFYGILDGDGHAISGSRNGERNDRNYLFTNSDGATFKNLTFKHIRKNSQAHHNQAIITSKAMNHCVFENISFYDVGTFSNYDNAGTAAGWAEDCTFTNITVRNSDVTVDQDQSGCVVGHAIGCTFTNISVEFCESTAAAESAYHDGKAGGVVGRSDNCTFNNVKIVNSYIVSHNEYGGGVAGYSTNSHYTNCTTDDMSCVKAVTYRVGGVVGYSEEDDFHNCINSALIICEDSYAGGIAGQAKDGTIIDGCLNTGMIFSSDFYTNDDNLYNSYQYLHNGFSIVIKTYLGKEYKVRDYNPTKNIYCGPRKDYGGIVGDIKGSVSKCVNLGYIYVYEGESYYGGIAGECDGTISDCLCDFSEAESVKEFCGKVDQYAKIKNCLNLRNASEDDLKSGKACATLGNAWEQHLGIDPYPTPTGNGLYYTRTVSNEYGTICLPFAMTSNDEISFYKLESISVDNYCVTLNFSYSQNVAAGEPALFRTTNTDEIMVNDAKDGYVFELEEPTTSELTNREWAMCGTFKQIEFYNEDEERKYVYYLSDGKIRNADHMIIAPYRAYFHGENLDIVRDWAGWFLAKEAIQFVLKDEDGETTALEFVGDELDNLNVNPNLNGIYNLAGQKVDGNYRGIVIKNGKKVLRK